MLRHDSNLLQRAIFACTPLPPFSNKHCIALNSRLVSSAMVFIVKRIYNFIRGRSQLIAP